jgi:Txe/YoeB family toxin of toxin-antitoxin system
MTALTATEARGRLYPLLEDVVESHEPIQIAGERQSAVLVSEGDWRAIQDTLFLESIPGMRTSIVKGLKTPATTCAKDLDWWAGDWSTAQARKDAKKRASSGLKPQAARLLAVLAENPYQTPPPFENLVGDPAGACSRSINIQHRFVYQVLDGAKTVKVIRMWTYSE